MSVSTSASAWPVSTASPSCLQPPEDAALLHRVAQLRHHYAGSHRFDPRRQKTAAQ
ncbi:MAG: hypothetical protein M0C28_16620 [Candidatus Moduliflexus flocculans]|nr:hypothetical protein [Candidatus Moduliflexus flocculans]